jgi:hypothetical protein
VSQSWKSPRSFSGSRFTEFKARDSYRRVRFVVKYPRTTPWNFIAYQVPKSRPIPWWSDHRGGALIVIQEDLSLRDPSHDQRHLQNYEQLRPTTKSHCMIKMNQCDSNNKISHFLFQKTSTLNTGKWDEGKEPCQHPLTHAIQFIMGHTHTHSIIHILWTNIYIAFSFVSLVLLVYKKKRNLWCKHILVW